MILLTLTSTGLAALSWKYIEKPFRDKNFIKRSTVFSLNALLTIFFISLGVFVNERDGYVGSHRNPAPNVTWRNLIEKIDAHGDACDRGALFEDNRYVTGCVFGNPAGKNTVIFPGDFHAQAISCYPDEELKKEKQGAFFRAYEVANPIHI